MGAMALAGALLGACVGPPPSSPSSIRAQIVEAEAAFTAATLAKDLPALKRMLGAEFRLEGASGRAVDRAAWLENLAAMDIRSYATRVTGVESADAVVHANLEGEWTLARNGQAREDKFQLQDTWVMRNGRWQIIRRYRLAPATTPDPADAAK